MKHLHHLCFAFILAVAFAGPACSTVTPSIVRPAQGSISGEGATRNSGIISYDDKAATWTVDGLLLARYRALLGSDAPAKRITPAAQPGDERWQISAYDFDRFLTASINHHSGIQH
jgi:hypothetical protein